MHTKTHQSQIPVSSVSRYVFGRLTARVGPAIPTLFPNTGISVLEKNQYQCTGINTGIQRLPILAVVDATKCKQYVVNDHLMSACIHIRESAFESAKADLLGFR